MATKRKKSRKVVRKTRTRTKTVYVESREPRQDFMGNAMNLMGGMMVLGVGASMIGALAPKPAV